MSELMINKSSKSDDTAATARLNLARTLLRSENFEPAATILTELCETFRSRPKHSIHLDALILFGEIHFRQSNYDTAYQLFQTALSLNPDYAARLPSATLHTCIANLSELPSHRDIFATHLHDYLATPDSYKPKVEGLAIDFLTKRYKLEDGLKDETILDMAVLSQDKVLLSAMAELVLTSRTFELMLCEIRKEILSQAASGNLQPEWLNLTRAFALRSFRNEYINPISEVEAKLVLEWLQFLDIPESPEPSDIQRNVYDLLVLSMYMPLNNIIANRSLERIPLNKWPMELMSLASKAIFEPQARGELWGSIPCLTQTSDETSLKVQAQYEAEPYPRWESLAKLAHVNYQQRYPYLADQILFQKAQPQSSPLSTLIAGCGTGHHALMVARNTKNLDVVAIDLSRASLAYAEQKRLAYEVNNVKFGQADILELDQFDASFDIVESVGVIHHMQNPELGLQKLVNKLQPNGVLMLGLYSTLGRTNIQSVRSKINAANLSRAEILSARNSILEDTAGLYNWADHYTDFFNYSEFRDLLFHVQETSYTLVELKALLDRNNLEFLGFSAPQNVLKNYCQMFPNDPSLRSLENWQQYEAQHPKTFSGMYQFHCKLKSN